MKERCQQLYQSLLKDLNECKGKFSCLKKEIEHCFVICNNYWAIVRDDTARYDFETAAEEIYFFKHLKPLFTTQVEYYGFYYHAQLFKSEVNDPVEIKQFLTREASRLEKFIAEHRNFYEYYKAGRTDKDILFFTRTKTNSGNLSLNELDAKAASSHDHLIASLLAIERYNEYIQKELNKYDPSFR